MNILEICVLQEVFVRFLKWWW